MTKEQLNKHEQANYRKSVKIINLLNKYIIMNVACAKNQKVEKTKNLNIYDINFIFFTVGYDIYIRSHYLIGCMHSYNYMPK